MSRYEYIIIIEDTLELCEIDSTLSDSIRYSIENQHLYLEEDEIEEDSIVKYEKPLEIVFSTKRTLEAGGNYKNKKVAVLNFASSLYPGGGALEGASAQEESICRCSTLLPCLANDYLIENFYQRHFDLIHSNRMNNLYNDDCSYTPGVCVFKSDTLHPKLMDKEDWYYVDVITSAAPNLYKNHFHPGDYYPEEDEIREILLRRIRKIFDVAVKEGVEVLILGAFGCGAFKNPPQIVAEVMKELIQDYLYSFEKIEFAIYSSHEESYNLRTFKRVFGRE